MRLPTLRLPTLRLSTLRLPVAPIGQGDREGRPYSYPIAIGRPPSSMTPVPFRFLTDSLRLDSLSVEPPADLDWSALLDHADAHSLTPLLCRVWSGAEWWRRLPTAIRGRLQRALSDNEVRQGRVRVELTEVASILDHARVPHIVLKGIPLAERLYGDLAERVIYDHDFLVPADVAERGHRALIAAGFRPLPAKDEWIEKHLPSVWRNDGCNWDGYLFDPNYPRPVELHLRLWEANWRGLNVRDLPDVWGDAVTRTMAGREMNLLSDEDTVIHLAMHFAGHLIEREARLNQLLDLARLVSALSGVGAVDAQSKGAKQPAEKVNWDRIFQKSRAANISRFIYASLYLAHEIFAAPLPPTGVWQTLRDETPPAFQRWLSEHGVEDVLSSSFRVKDKGKEYELTFLAARSFAERLGILRFAALPPLGQLMAKYNAPNRWLAALMLPRYYAERLYTANLKRS